MKNLLYAIIACIFISPLSIADESATDATLTDVEVSKNEVLDQIHAFKITANNEIVSLEENKVAKIGVIRLNKMMVKSTYGLITDFINLYNDDRIKGILIIMEDYSTDEHLQDLILDIRRKKPVVGYVVDGCASAGYAIMSSCDYLVSSTGTVLGYIGTLTENPGIKKSNKNSDMIIISSSDNDLATSAKTIVSLQHRYELFYKNVAEKRNLNPQESPIWAEGKIFTPEAALKLGLIDAVGSLQDATENLLKLIAKRDPEYKDSINIHTIEFEIIKRQK